MSDHYQAELHFLGATSSPAFVRQPEGNGCAEHFICVLKEQVLLTQWFETIEDLRLALLAFKERYNRDWLVERHSHRTPSQVRAIGGLGSVTRLVNEGPRARAALDELSSWRGSSPSV